MLRTASPSWSAERRLLIALAAYFLARAVARTLISNTPEWDEAEQLIQTQTWSWGYGPQPPLYTWVQKLFFLGLGTNIFALASLNALLLFGTCAISYRVGKEASGDDGVGLVAALSLFLVPQFVWSAQVDLTHSDMGMFFTVVTMLLAVRLLRERTTARYLWLGAVAAAGVLSKYNYLVFFVALIIALASFPDGRRVLADKRFALTVGLLLLLLVPHLNWVRHNPELAMRKLPYLYTPGEISWWRGWRDGFATLAASLLVYFAPLYVGWAIVLQRLPKGAELWPANDPQRRSILFRRLLAVSLLLYVAAILAVRAKFKERWIQPNMYALPLVLVFGLAAELSIARLKRFAAVTGTVAVVIFFVLAGRVMLAGKTKVTSRENMPYRELAAKLKRAGLQPSTIIADTGPPGAAFRFEFPGALVLVPGQLAPETPAGAKLVIWEADASAHTLEILHRFAAERGIPEQAFAQAGVVEAPMKYFARRKVSLNYFLVPAATDSSTPMK